MVRRTSNRLRSRHNHQQKPPSLETVLLKYYHARLGEKKRSRSLAEDQPSDLATDSVARFKADIERRDKLTAEQRLEEEGRQLASALKQRPLTLLILQSTPNPVSRWAQCRALECLYATSESGLHGAEIRDEYRIALEWDGQCLAQYYHVQCMECMIPLASLARLQFKLEGNFTWGLMIGKWVEHRGRIDLDKIVTYMDKLAVYSEWHADRMHEFSTIELQHQVSCREEPSLCSCPQLPRGPKVPVLKNYVIEKSCKLWDVISHPYGEKGYYFGDKQPPWRFDPPEDLESETLPN